MSIKLRIKIGRKVNKYEHLKRKWSIVRYFHVKYCTPQLFYV